MRCLLAILIIGCAATPKPAASASPPAAPAPAPTSSAGAASAAPPSGRRAIAWIADEVAAYALARKEGKGVLAELTATWCIPCEELEHQLELGATYDTITQRFVPLRIDVSEDSPDSAAQRARYSAQTLPALVFMDVDGRVLGRVSRVLPDAELLPVVQSAAAALRPSKPTP